LSWRVRMIMIRVFLLYLVKVRLNRRVRMSHLRSLLPFP